MSTHPNDCHGDVSVEPEGFVFLADCGTRGGPYEFSAEAWAGLALHEPPAPEPATEPAPPGPVIARRRRHTRTAPANFADIRDQLHDAGRGHLAGMFDQ